MKLTQNVAIAILKASAKNDWSELINEAIATLESISLASYENLPQHIITLGTTIGKIAAVKQLRLETGFDLRTSVDIVANYFARNGIEFKKY